MPVPHSITPIERKPVRGQIYEKLRDWIVSGTLRPNEQVRDTELATRLGVSRTPVREALQRLEDEGLVHTAPNRWTRVSAIDIEDARKIYPIVASLECLAVRLSGAQLMAADLQEMAEANERVARALRRKDPVDASAADCSFHLVPARRADNPELTRVLRELRVKLRRLEVAYFDRGALIARSVVEHKRILEALKRNDVEDATRCIEANWCNSLTRLTEAGVNAKPVALREVASQP
jgi:DNA-binding GntR family transcriptional regulator